MLLDTTTKKKPLVARLASLFTSFFFLETGQPIYLNVR